MSTDTHSDTVLYIFYNPALLTTATFITIHIYATGIWSEDSVQLASYHTSIAVIFLGIGRSCDIVYCTGLKHAARWPNVARQVISCCPPSSISRDTLEVKTQTQSPLMTNYGPIVLLRIVNAIEMHTCTTFFGDTSL